MVFVLFRVFVNKEIFFKILIGRKNSVRHDMIFGNFSFEIVFVKST